MARKHFESRGEHPSEAKIRDFLGFGSDTTINKLNNEILAETRMKILSKSVHLPEELPTLWMASAASKADEMTAAIAGELEEKNRSLLAATEQLTSLREEKTAQNSLLADLQGQITELREEALKEKTACESIEKTSQSTIERLDATIETISADRDGLRSKNYELATETARHKEAAEHQAKEIMRLENAAHDMGAILQQERQKLAVAQERTQTLSKTVEERSSGASLFSNLESTLITRLNDIEKSLLSVKQPQSKSSSGKNGRSPQTDG